MILNHIILFIAFQILLNVFNTSTVTLLQLFRGLHGFGFVHVAIVEFPFMATFNFKSLLMLISFVRFMSSVFDVLLYTFIVIKSGIC